MIALWLLSAHLTGDFLLQNRWHAALKQTEWRARARHVTSYTLPFVPVAVVYGGWRHGLVGFVVGLAVLHFITDSRRFRSTPGDVLQWKAWWYGPGTREPLVALRLEHELKAAVVEGRAAVRVSEREERWPPPNPWPPTSMMVDQSLHVLQITVLAAVFLS